MAPSRDDDMERILWTEAEIAARVTELASEVSEDLKASAAPVAVVGVATGAFLFLADLARRIALPFTVDLVRVESYGSGTESCGAPRISSDVKLDVKGKHVILLEKCLTEEEGKLRELADPTIHGTFAYDSLRTAAEIAVNCVSRDVGDRPSIDDILWNMQYSVQVQDGWASHDNFHAVP